MTPAIFTFQEACEVGGQNRFPGLTDDELKSIAQDLGVPNVANLQRSQICNALAPLAHDLIHNRPRCENHKTTNLSGDTLNDIPPYLIYTFPMTRENDDDPPVRVVNGTFCSDIRDLVHQIEANRHRPVVKHPLYTHIILTPDMKKDIMTRWSVLTDYGKNPPEARPPPVINAASMLGLKITDFLQQLFYPPYTTSQFKDLDESKLLSFLDHATHYHIMRITVEDIERLKPITVDSFITFLNRKAIAARANYPTFMMILSNIIADNREFLNHHDGTPFRTPPDVAARVMAQNQALNQMNQWNQQLFEREQQLEQRITDFLQQLGGTVQFSARQFRFLGENKLESIVIEATHYHYMNISQADYNAILHHGPFTVDIFIDFMNQKANEAPDRAVFFTALLNIINGTSPPPLVNQSIAPQAPPVPIHWRDPLSSLWLRQFGPDVSKKDKINKALAILAGSASVVGATTAGAIYGHKKLKQKRAKKGKKNMK